MRKYKNQLEETIKRWDERLNIEDSDDNNNNNNAEKDSDDNNNDNNNNNRNMRKFILAHGMKPSSLTTVARRHCKELRDALSKDNWKNLL